MHRLLALLALLVSLTVPAAAMSMEPPTIGVRSTTFGPIVTDGRGFALYAFTKDRKGGPSTCYGACATAWPPLIVKSRPRGIAGARTSLVGTTRRKDGRLQATYAGRPVYFYVGDRKPAQVLCQDVAEFGGTWLVVRASGALVR